MASSTKTVQNSQAPTSPPQPKPQVVQTPEDPMVVQAVQQIEEMDLMQMARAAGQVLYDLAIQDPVITVASPEILGMTLKKTILNDDGKFNNEYMPLLCLYLKHSLVARDPRLVAVAMCRIVTIQLYAAGKLSDASKANTASA